MAEIRSSQKTLKGRRSCGHGAQHATPLRGGSRQDTRDGDAGARTLARSNRKTHVQKRHVGHPPNKSKREDLQFAHDTRRRGRRKTQSSCRHGAQHAGSLRKRQRREEELSIEPRTPRTIWRPRVLPIARTADFAIASGRLSPRRPVLEPLMPGMLCHHDGEAGA